MDCTGMGCRGLQPISVREHATVSLGEIAFMNPPDMSQMLSEGDVRRFGEHRPAIIEPFAVQYDDLAGSKVEELGLVVEGADLGWGGNEGRHLCVGTPESTWGSRRRGGHDAKGGERPHPV